MNSSARKQSQRGLVDGARCSLAVFAVAAAVAIGSCDVGSIATPVSTATPIAIPSPACGGFHLYLTNTSSISVLERHNALDSMTVTPHEDGAIVYQYGPGGVSDMPWHVEFIDPASGAVIASHDLTQTDGGGGVTIAITPATMGGGPVIGGVTPVGGC